MSNTWLIGAVVLITFGFWLGYKVFHKKLQGEVGNRKKLAGTYAQKFVPFLDEFEYNPGDSYFLGMPIDYIVFDGLNDGYIEKVVFIEVKTGGSQVSKREDSIKSAIEAGRVEWKEIRL